MTALLKLDLVDNERCNRDFPRSLYRTRHSSFRCFSSRISFHLKIKEGTADIFEIS